MAHSCDHECENDECNCDNSIKSTEQNEMQDYLNNEIELITEQLKIIDSNTLQLNSAIEAINGLENSNDEELLVPLANGIFYKTKTQKNQSLLVNVGSDIFVNKSTKDVDILLKTQLEELKKNRDALLQQYTTSMNFLTQIQGQ